MRYRVRSLHRESLDRFIAFVGQVEVVQVTGELDFVIEVDEPVRSRFGVLVATVDE